MKMTEKKIDVDDKLEELVENSIKLGKVEEKLNSLTPIQTEIERRFNRSQMWFYIAMGACIAIVLQSIIRLAVTGFGC